MSPDMPFRIDHSTVTTIGEEIVKGKIGYTHWRAFKW